MLEDCTLTTYTPEAVTAVAALAYTIYVRWSRLGPLISLTPGCVNRGGLLLAIVVCSFINIISGNVEFIC